MPISLDDLSALPWEPFRDGIDAVWIYRTPDNGPAAALLRYQPGAAAPRHRHVGWETIHILEGSQSDQHAEYGTGCVTANAPGTEHSVFSEKGCVALLVWERPPEFLDD